MFSNNQEFYAYIEALCQKLTLANEEKWSKALRDAMAISSLSGEVLGELRLTLKKLQETQIPLRLGIKDEIRDIIRGLDKILN